MIFIFKTKIKFWYFKNIRWEKGNQNDKMSFNKEKAESVLPKGPLKRDKWYIEQYIVETIKNYNVIKEYEGIKFN